LKIKLDYIKCCLYRFTLLFLLKICFKKFFKGKKILSWALKKRGKNNVKGSGGRLLISISPLCSPYFLFILARFNFYGPKEKTMKLHHFLFSTKYAYNPSHPSHFSPQPNGLLLVISSFRFSHSVIDPH